MPKFRKISSNLAFRDTAGESNFMPIWRVRPPLSYLRAVLQHHFKLLALNDPLPQHLTQKKLCTLNCGESCWENIDSLLMGRVSCFLIDKKWSYMNSLYILGARTLLARAPTCEVYEGTAASVPTTPNPRSHKEPLRIGSRNLLTLFTAYPRVG